jgi:SulP family sulfate permease
VEHVGKDNIVPHVQAALERAREINSRFSGLGENAARDLEHASL